MNSSRIRIFVPDVPEFSALVEAAKREGGCRVTTPLPHYRLIESAMALEFRRKELGLQPAVWYGLFTGGLKGQIEIYGRDLVRILPVE